MTAQDSAPPAASPTPDRRCENCGSPLFGEHCFACGQPTKGLIRQFSDILGDFFDTVLNIDARIFRTLGPLLAHPGRLSLEYFAGHRVRYVSPVRLFVFLSIITFVVARWVTPDIHVDNNGHGNAALHFGGKGTGMAQARTVAEVEKQRDLALAKLDEAIKQGQNVPGLKEGLQASQKTISEQADRRIAELRAAPPTPSTNSGKAAPTTPKPPSRPGVDDDGDNEGDFNFNGKPWDAKTNPVAVGWLGETGNGLLNRLVGRAKANGQRIKNDPNMFKNAVFSAMPTALFVLLPIFALLLKITYVFKRRLYMEHLIVALHSHAFLCVGTLLLIAVNELQAWFGPQPGFIHGLTGWMAIAVWIWMPLYLLIMQKRIYGQGWLMTLIKYFSLGFVYVILLSFGVAATMVATLIWL